jgi:hypothetical protein
MDGDRLSAIASTDPGLREALRQLRGRGLRDGSGPDPLYNADVAPEVLSEFLTLAVRESPDSHVFGLALTLPGLIYRRGAGTQALDLLLRERPLTASQRDWVRQRLEAEQSAAGERGAQARSEVPAMDDESRAAAMRVLDVLYAGGFDPDGGSDPADLFVRLVEFREMTGMRAVRAAVHARVLDLVEEPATSAAGIGYVEAAIQVGYLYSDELAMDLRRSGAQIAADQAARFELAVVRLDALATRLGPSPR